MHLNIKRFPHLYSYRNTCAGSLGEQEITSGKTSHGVVRVSLNSHACKHQKIYYFFYNITEKKKDLSIDILTNYYYCMYSTY